MVKTLQKNKEKDSGEYPSQEVGLNTIADAVAEPKV
jgi:hypothetical protein